MAMKGNCAYKEYPDHPLLHTGYREPSETQVGKALCEICGAEGRLILRQGKHFKRWFVRCPNGHSPTTKKELIDAFSLGDRVRKYYIDFSGKIHWDNFTEGVIIKKKPSIAAYMLTYKVDKVYIAGKRSFKSWLNGQEIEVSSDVAGLELLTPQLKFRF
ncbi:MAG: hypothetical protein H0Z24_03265 [Thermosipho sp. (in: Bacteria)]|nr:hypothetical protein [Thermosipho sp. (in: thermotogales)]